MPVPRDGCESCLLAMIICMYLAGGGEFEADASGDRAQGPFQSSSLSAGLPVPNLPLESR